MTVRGKTAKRDQEIKRMLIECYPVSAIARFSHVSDTRVRQIRDRFVASGEIMAVPHTKPIIYVDPHACALGTEFADNDGGAENNGLTRGNTGVRDSLPPNGWLPLGMVNGHVCGRISLTVRRKGTYDDVRGPDGFYIGYWDKPGSGGRGKVHCKGHLRLFKQDLTVNFYESTKGTMEFYVNPGRVYYYPSKVTRQQVLDYIMERVMYVASLLKATGWEVTDPQLPKNYQFHRGKENDPLSFLIPPRYHEGQDVTSDTSPGYLETEIEDASDEKLVEIYANMPSAIRDVSDRVSAARTDLATMRADILALKEIVHIQGEVIGSMAGNITGLASCMTRLTTMEASALEQRFSAFTGEGYR